MKNIYCVKSMRSYLKTVVEWWVDIDKSWWLRLILILSALAVCQWFWMTPSPPKSECVNLNSKHEVKANENP